MRRTTGSTPGRLFAAEIAEPLGLRFWIRLPLDAEGVAPLIEDPSGTPDVRSDDPLPTPSASAWNDAAVLRTEQPAASGVGDARSVALLYAAAIDPVAPLLTRDALDLAVARRTGPDLDRVLGLPTVFGAGFQLPSTLNPMLGPRSFGHAGAGGSIGLADRDSGVTIGYVTGTIGRSPRAATRAARLAAAVRRLL
jgi:hypothetical protein